MEGSCFSGPPPFTQAWPGLLCWGLEHARPNQDSAKSYLLSEQMEQLTKKSLQLLLDNWRVLRARSSSCLLCLAAPEIPVFTNTESQTNEHTGPGANWIRHRHRYWGFCWERQEKVINTKGQDSTCTMSAQVASEADFPRGNIPGSLAHTHLWVTRHQCIVLLLAEPWLFWWALGVYLLIAKGASLLSIAFIDYAYTWQTWFSEQNHSTWLVRNK